MKIVLLLATIAVVTGAYTQCKYRHKKIGCHWEDKSGKVLFNHREDIPWGLNQSTFVNGLACDCEARARLDGYKYFALRFYGICIGLKNGNKGSKSLSNCPNGIYKPCDLNSKDDCTGDGNNSEMVYQIGRDGGYSEYGDYGTCSVTCGVGSTQRTRKCDNPTPLANGDDCDVLGPSIETVECTRKACPGDGQYGRWSDWSKCSQSCGNGLQERKRLCDSPAPSNGGKNCEGVDLERQECNEGKCAVDGGYGKWSGWSECTKTCGKAYKQRERKCDSPTPSNGGKQCGVGGTQVKVCPQKLCPVDGGLSEWSAWSLCSKSCGGGSSTMTRECNNPKPALGGNDCVGNRFKYTECNTQKCTVDGGLGEWSSWSACSKTCGGGYHKRSRNCDNPSPSHGGKNCKGSRDEAKACTNDFCKGPTGVSKAQELVETFLENFHKNKYPDKTPSGKFYKSIFEIQKAVAEEFISVDPTSKDKPLDQRLKDLEKFLKAATEGGSIDFARNTLGKGLFTFTKQKIEEGLPLDDLNLAAKGYLDKLRTDIGDDKMNEILSSQGDATLMFTMDTTGSMKDEINAAKAIAKQIIDSTRDFDVDYILSPFNDPRTGPVTYKTTADRAGFVSDIDRLRAKGGGDCPELAFKGMLNAIDKGPKYGSPMFVFTDATAKDDSASNIAALKAAASMNGASITFFTNLQGCSKGSKRGIESFKEIASYTSGQVFPLKNEAELLKFTEFVKSSLQQDTIIASGGALAARYKRSVSGGHSFNVDDGIAKLIVSVAVQQPNSAQYVNLRSPDSDTATASTTMSMARIFEITDPQPGLWFVEFPTAVGKYEFSAQAVSKNPIEFSYNFMYQESERKNSPPFSMMHPFKGRENMMVIRIGGIARIQASSLRVDVVDTHGNMLIKDITIKELDSKDIYSTKMSPPDVPFKIRLSGRTQSGHNFERISSGIAKAATAYMRATFAGNEFTATIGKGAVTAQVQVLNIGDEDTITFNVAASIGSIQTKSQSKNIRNMGFIQIGYIPPRDISKHGKVDRITITARKRKTGEIFTQNISILLIKQ